MKTAKITNTAPVSDEISVLYRLHGRVWVEIARGRFASIVDLCAQCNLGLTNSGYTQSFQRAKADLLIGFSDDQHMLKRDEKHVIKYDSVPEKPESKLCHVLQRVSDKKKFFVFPKSSSNNLDARAVAARA